MARPKKDESLHRGKRVYIRFTELEYELVAGYAKDAGYPIGTFVRKQALREKLEVNYSILTKNSPIPLTPFNPKWRKPEVMPNSPKPN